MGQQISCAILIQNFPQCLITYRNHTDIERKAMTISKVTIVFINNKLFPKELHSTSEAGGNWMDPTGT